MDKYRQIRWIRFLPLVLGLVGLPMVFRMVPPNPVYGLRTAATLASSTTWYSANFWSGLTSVVAGVIATAGNVALDRSSSVPPERKMWLVIASILPVAIVPALVGILAT